MLEEFVTTAVLPTTIITPPIIMHVLSATTATTTLPTATPEFDRQQLMATLQLGVASLPADAARDQLHWDELAGSIGDDDDDGYAAWLAAGAAAAAEEAAAASANPQDDVDAGELGGGGFGGEVAVPTAAGEALAEETFLPGAAVEVAPHGAPLAAVSLEPDASDEETVQFGGCAVEQQLGDGGASHSAAPAEPASPAHSLVDGSATDFTSAQGSVDPDAGVNAGAETTPDQDVPAGGLQGPTTGASGSGARGSKAAEAAA